MKPIYIFCFWVSCCFFLSVLSCTKDELEPKVDQPGRTHDGVWPSNIWTGRWVSFNKPGGANPRDSIYQDRITDRVWITRGNRGQFFNIAIEDNVDKNLSPLGTEWALGVIEDWQSLSYGPFRQSIGQPKEAIGDSLVVHLVEEDIYLGLVIVHWFPGGGFAYNRSTPEG